MEANHDQRLSNPAAAVPLPVWLLVLPWMVPGFAPGRCAVLWQGGCGESEG